MAPSVAFSFLLVLARIAGLVAVAPEFGHAAVPRNVRVMLALAIAWCVWPVVAAGDGPTTLPGLALGLVAEAAVGATLGLITGLALLGLQWAGGVIGHVTGWSLAMTLEPDGDSPGLPLEQLAWWLGLVIFLTAGGHRETLRLLLASYDVLPLGQGLPAARMTEGLLAGLQLAGASALRLSVPVVIACLAVHLVLGWVGRFLPALASLSTPVNSMLGLLMILLGVAAWSPVTQQLCRDTLACMQRLLPGG